MHNISRYYYLVAWIDGEIGKIMEFRQMSTGHELRAHLVQ